MGFEFHEFHEFLGQIVFELDEPGGGGEKTLLCRYWVGLYLKKGSEVYVGEGTKDPEGGSVEDVIRLRHQL